MSVVLQLQQQSQQQEQQQEHQQQQLLPWYSSWYAVAAAGVGGHIKAITKECRDHSHSLQVCK